MSISLHKLVFLSLEEFVGASDFPCSDEELYLLPQDVKRNTREKRYENSLRRVYLKDIK